MCGMGHRAIRAVGRRLNPPVIRGQRRLTNAEGVQMIPTTGAGGFGCAKNRNRQVKARLLRWTVGAYATYTGAIGP